MGLTSADLARLGPEAQQQVRKAMSRERRQAESVHFFVDGRPVPKGRPRVTRHGTYTPKSTQDYEAAIRAAWEREHVMPFAEGDALELDVVAYFPIPKGTPKKRSEEMVAKPYTKRGDLDNIVKSVMDALNGYAYPDDAAIWNIAARKRYTNETPVTIVTLTKSRSAREFTDEL